MITKSFLKGNWNEFSQLIKVIIPSKMELVRTKLLPLIDQILVSMLKENATIEKSNIEVLQCIDKDRFTGIACKLTYNVDDFNVPEAPEEAIAQDIEAIKNAIQIEGITVNEVQIDVNSGILTISVTVPFTKETV